MKWLVYQLVMISRLHGTSLSCFCVMSLLRCEMLDRRLLMFTHYKKINFYLFGNNIEGFGFVRELYYANFVEFLSNFN